MLYVAWIGFLFLGLSVFWGLDLPVEEAVICEESSGGLDPGRHVVDVD